MATNMWAEPQPQPVLAPLSATAIFLAMTIRPGGEATVRGVLFDLGDLIKAVSSRNSDAQLTCVAGVGSDAWERLFSGACPVSLHPIRPVAGVNHNAPATLGDGLFHIRAQRFDFCFELSTLLVRQLSGAVDVVDEVHGFRYFDARDLLGFMDGTANPIGSDAAKSAHVGDRDPPFRNGSYAVVQNYLHDLDRWNTLTVEQQEHMMGRTKLDNIEVDTTAGNHVTLNTITDEHGLEHDIVRDNMPFGRVGTAEFGTYFIGYAADPAVTERMLERMFVGDLPGTYDHILDVSTAVTGTLFSVPSADLLNDLPPSPKQTESPQDTQ